MLTEHQSSSLYNITSGSFRETGAKTRIIENDEVRSYGPV